MQHVHPIFTRQFDSSEVAFTTIDKEITTLNENIRALLSFRNTFTPTYHLPSEILARIFSCLRDIYTSYPGRGELRWLFVSLVSRHWRSVALSSPTLWSKISGSYHEVTMVEWLRRSKAAPLSIDFYYPILEHMERYISPHLSRIRNLTLMLSSDQALASLLSSPAPLLEHLEITISGKGAMSSTTLISGTLFGGQAPRLQRLMVAGCSVDIKSSIFRDLTKLELRNSTNEILAPDLLSTLRRLPRLTSLSLIDLFDPDDDTTVDVDVDMVTLAALESLIIADGESFIQDLYVLSHLSFPESTTLQFKSRAWAETDDPVVALSDFLRVQKTARHPMSLPAPPMIGLVLLCSSRWIRLSLYDTMAKMEEDANTPGALDFWLTGTWDGDLELLDHPEATTLFSYLDLQYLTSVKVNCEIGTDIWRDIFGQLPDLKNIDIVGGSVPHVLEVIVDDYKAMKSSAGGAVDGGLPNEGSWTPIFPSLEMLHLEKSNIPDGNDLFQALSARMQIDKGIKRLKLVKCMNVDLDWVAELEDIVGQVTWDGWMGDDDDDDDDDEDSEEETEEGSD